MGWITLDVGLVEHPKLVGLPSHAARWGWITVLVAAKRQRIPGTFADRRHAATVVGEYRRFLDAYVRAGLLDESEDGLTVHDWQAYQRDPTGADRTARWRDKQRHEPVTPPVTPPSPVTPEGRRDRRARYTDTDSDIDRDRKKVTTTSNPVRRNGAGMPDVRLTAEQLAAWSGFGHVWDDFKRAWLGRGFLWPPAGEPDDDDTSQRGLLWQVLDSRPTDLPVWVKAAPGTTTRQVVAYVLDRWHEVREAVDPDTADAPSSPGERRAAAESLGSIMARLPIAGDAA